MPLQALTPMLSRVCLSPGILMLDGEITAVELVRALQRARAPPGEQDVQRVMH